MANDLNSVIVIGNVVRDCGADQNSFSYTQQGTAIARISIAVNRTRTQNGQKNEETSFFDVTIFGKPAEALKPYLTKGKKIAVRGSLKQDRWKDQQGNNRSRVGIIADDIQLLSVGNGGQGEGYNPNTAYSSTQSALQADRQGGSAPQTQPAPSSGQQDSMGFPEDYPF